MTGAFDAPLIDMTPVVAKLKACKTLGERKVYSARAYAGIEAVGYTVMESLTGRFGGAVFVAWKDETAGSRLLRGSHLALLPLLPNRFRLESNLYERILGVTDFLSGMTDSFTVDLYRRIMGMTLNSQ